VLTAGHNADLNHDGLPDTSWSATLHLPGIGAFGIAEAFTLLSFSGFANPSVNDDLALLRLAAPLPLGMGYPTLGKGAGIGDIITLVGFGRSGYGDTGGGVLVDPYMDWIYQTTGIPEPGTPMLWMLSAGCWIFRRKRSATRPVSHDSSNSRDAGHDA